MFSKNFQPEVHYSEKQVNEILARFHDDTATLRREMIVYKLMAEQKENIGELMVETTLIKEDRR